MADKPPAPPPSVTPAHSPYLYRLSFLIFDFAFKVMCFSPVMKSVFNRNTKWISLSPFLPGSFLAKTRSFPVLSSFAFCLCGFSSHWRQWGEGGLNATQGWHDVVAKIYVFILLDEVHLGAWSKGVYKKWVDWMESWPCFPFINVKESVKQSKHFIRQLFTSGFGLIDL